MKRYQYAKKAIFIAAISALNPAYAEDQATELDDIVVWGTAISASSVNLDKDVMDIKQADHVSDLLRVIPGVDVGGAHSLNQRITVRSMDDKDVRISIDGANQNSYMFHHMGNLQIHADILKSVDIDVGKNSVVNGGLGGAVRFKTKSADELLENGQSIGGRAQASYSSNDGESYALTGFGRITDNIDVLAYYNDVKRGNFKVGGGEIKDENGIKIPGTDGKVRGLEGNLDDSLLKFGFNISDEQRVEVGYEKYNDEGNYSQRPDMGLATDLSIAAGLGIPLTWPTKFTRDTATINYEANLGDSSKLDATLYTNISELFRDENGWSQASIPRFRGLAGTTEGEAENSGLNILASTDWDQHSLTYGGEFIHYKTTFLGQYVGGSGSSQEKSTNTSAYIEDRIQLTDRFALTSGLRFDSVDLEATLVDKSFEDITGALKGELQITDSTLMTLSSSQLFQAPELAEVFIGAGLNDTPNPDIKAETGLNNEFSIKFSDSTFGADDFSIGITAFQTGIDDYIYDYAGIPGGGPRDVWKDNVGDMKIEGYEAYIGYEIGTLNTLLTFSKTDSELTAFSDYSSLDKARIDRQQGDTASLNIDYSIADNSIKLHWDALIVAKVEDDLNLDGASLSTAKGNYTVHNISAMWLPKQAKGLSLTVGVDNVFDDFYASQSSRTGISNHPVFGSLYLTDYEPGRNIKVTAAYKF